MRDDELNEGIEPESEPTRSKARRYFDTRLDRFLADNHVGPAELERRSGYSRQHLLRLRSSSDPGSPRSREKLVVVLREMTKKPVTEADLWDELLPKKRG